MNRKVIAAGVAALAVVGSGAAVAATTFASPKQESKAVVDDAAQQLGIDPTKLSDALKKALENRVDAAVAAGRLTNAQGDALKKQIESQDYPMLAGPGFGGPHGGPGGHGFPHLSAAADYLGVTEAKLQTQLGAGKTLADVANAQRKTVDGLVAALVADEKKELAAAVSAGQLTQAQADQMLANAKQRFTDVVNGTMPDHGHAGFRGFGPPSTPPSPSSSTAAYAGPSI